jgi:hypothetical protein
MALSFANTAGNLFNRLGRYGKLALVARVFQGDLATYFNALLAQYDSSVASPLQLPENNIPSLRDATQESASLFMDSLIGNATTTVLEMVKADKPSVAGSLQDAITEIRSQMITAGASVKKCTVAASVVAGANTGDGVVSVSAKRGDGLDQELMFPEVAYIRCVGDSQTGGATAGQEQFLYYGPVSARGVWSPNYPIGSGTSTGFTVIDPTVDGTSATYYGNILTNGSFEAFTSNTPNGWTATTGAAGTNFQQGATVYAGTKSLQFIGSAVSTALEQTLLQGALSPSTSFGVCLWARVSSAPGAGVLTVELIDGSGTVINDDQGAANSYTINLVTIGTTFVNQRSVFRLPKLVPSTVKLRLRMSTQLSGGTNAFVDHLSMGRLVQAYPGGPGMVGHSGATKFVANDFFTMTTTNDYGGASNLSTIQWLADRLFKTRSMGILLPSNAAPTIPDTLITS